MYENIANIENKPISGYYGFKLYFPVLGDLILNVFRNVFKSVHF